MVNPGVLQLSISSSKMLLENPRRSKFHHISEISILVLDFEGFAILQIIAQNLQWIHLTSKPHSEATICPINMRSKYDIAEISNFTICKKKVKKVSDGALLSSICEKWAQNQALCSGPGAGAAPPVASTMNFWKFKNSIHLLSLSNRVWRNMRLLFSYGSFNLKIPLQ